MSSLSWFLAHPSTFGDFIVATSAQDSLTESITTLLCKAALEQFIFWRMLLKHNEIESNVIATALQWTTVGFKRDKGCAVCSNMQKEWVCMLIYTVDVVYCFVPPIREHTDVPLGCEALEYSISVTALPFHSLTERQKTQACWEISTESRFYPEWSGIIPIGFVMPGTQQLPGCQFSQPAFCHSQGRMDTFSLEFN